jgi:hypothetical protein
MGSKVGWVGLGHQEGEALFESVWFDVKELKKI